jgi:hypothetical protein
MAFGPPNGIENRIRRAEGDMAGVIRPHFLERRIWGVCGDRAVPQVGDYASKWSGIRVWQLP